MHGCCLCSWRGMFNLLLSFNNCVLWTGWRDADFPIAAWFATFCFLQRTCFHQFLMPKKVWNKSSKAWERRERRERERLEPSRMQGYWWGGGRCQQSDTQRWLKFHDLVKTNTCWHCGGLGQRLRRATWVQKLNSLTIIYLPPAISSILSSVAQPSWGPV